jgi:arylsulfatase A-like enzyme/HEAT repeat protein
MAGATSSSSRLASALASGVWLGAGAGLMSALSDYGAHWLFMESGRDRWALLLRLLSTQVPACAALGLAAALVYWVASGPSHALALRSTKARPDHRRRWQRAYLALGLTLPVVPACWMVAAQLFRGGRMKQLQAGAWLQTGVALALCVVVVVALYVALSLVRHARGASRRGALLATAPLLTVGFVASKLDQHTLPNLYAYLHAVLAVTALTAFAAAIAAVAVRLRGIHRLGRGPVVGAVLFAALLAGAWAHGFRALDENQNVRVALLSANMPHSRTLFLGLEPLLPRVDPRLADAARKRAAMRRAARTGASDPSTQLPTTPDSHVLLISIDALRADRLGALGNTRKLTPELDALAARGVLFERAYAQAPHSSYSLSSLMTSEYLHETLDLGQPAPTETLASVLADAGYHTAAFYTRGIFHTAGEKLALYENNAFGFALHDHQDRPAELMTDRVLSEVDRVVERGEPSSLLWVHYFDVHEPYEATTLGTSDVDRYDSEILATDRAIGRLTREVERRFDKPVTIAVTADHGEEFHEHGGVYHGSSLYDEQVRIPLIVVSPALPATRIATPVESVDIAPTLLGLADIAAPTSMRGVDLRALALGQGAPRGPVFSAVIHKKMVVSWPYKLIADLRFSLFELYDLQNDPRERDNLADRDPQRMQALRGEVYAWLDSLTLTRERSEAEGPIALVWGRLGDRRAVEPLARLVLDDAAPSPHRSEAARLLGKLADTTAAHSLFAATGVRDGWVRAEAAIALGRMFDPRAASMLRKLVDAEDPGIRSRAAVSLGRLRDPHAVPALIDALWIAPSGYEREEAIRWLGRLRQPAALEPLIEVLREPHTRHLVVIALGDLGDARGFEPLTQVLAYERNTNVRDGVMRALGTLGDPRALDVIVPLATQDASLGNAAESLVRLDAVKRGYVGGTDITRALVSPQTFDHCYAGPLRHDWDYLRRTYCRTRAASTPLSITVPPRVTEANGGAVLVMALRRADSVKAVSLKVNVDDQALSTAQADGAWVELRWPIAPGTLHAPSVRVEIETEDPKARLDVDHILVLPRATTDAVANR